LQYKERENLSKENREKIIASCYAKLPVTNPYLKYSYNAYSYIINYYNFLSYKEFSLTSIEPLYKRNEFVIKGKKVTIDNESSQFLYMKDLKVVEELWALFMVNGLFFIPDGVLSETIEKYKSIFPESKWLPVLTQQEADCTKTKFEEYAFSSPVIYMDSLISETKASPDANSLQGIFKLLPIDKPVFIDIWASWCGPCVKAFEFNRELDSFLLTNKITKLYISLDGKSQITAWKNAIQKYKLGGFHILANNDLIKAIKQVYKIQEKEGITIPRYLLVSKQKNLVLPTASSPSEFNKLKEEINKYLIEK
jgi:thiol-disulfide isomerase/thioredoxin